MSTSKLAQTHLKPWVYTFINELISNGYNQTRALQAVKPHLKPKTACTLAKRLLDVVEVQTVIHTLTAKQEEQQLIQTLSSRETLIKEAEEVRTMAKTSKQPQLKHMLGAIDLKGRLGGAFDREASASEQIQSFIGKLQINNTQVNVGVDKSKGRLNVGAHPAKDNKAIDCIDGILETTDKIDYVKYDGKKAITE